MLGLWDASIVKLNSNGAEIWRKQIGTHANDIITSAAADSVGNLYITGYTVTNIVGSADAFVSKYNWLGELIWARILQTNVDDYGSAVALDPTGDILVYGETRGSLYERIKEPTTFFLFGMIQMETS